MQPLLHRLAPFPIRQTDRMFPNQHLAWATGGYQPGHPSPPQNVWEWLAALGLAAHAPAFDRVGHTFGLILLAPGGPQNWCRCWSLLHAAWRPCNKHLTPCRRR